MLDELRRQHAVGPGEHFKRATFRPYGLDDRWKGLRSFGGWAASNDEVTGLSLAHGDAPWDPASQQIRVETRIPRHVGLHDSRAAITLERTLLAQAQLNNLWHRTGQLPADARRAAFPIDVGPSDPTGPWDRVELRVDDQPIDFRILAVGDFWVGLAEHRETLIGIDSQSWPPETTGLVTVRDVEPYEVGSREIRARFPQPPD